MCDKGCWLVVAHGGFCRSDGLVWLLLWRLWWRKAEAYLYIFFFLALVAFIYRRRQWKWGRHAAKGHPWLLQENCSLLCVGHLPSPLCCRGSPLMHFSCFDMYSFKTYNGFLSYSILYFIGRPQKPIRRTYSLLLSMCGSILLRET